MKSMTGYGSSRVSNKSIDLDSNIKTVNGRFLEVKFHLPRIYAPLENEVKAIVKKHIRRGTADIYISRRAKDLGTQMKVYPQKELAELWLKSAKKLEKDLGFKNTQLDMAQILNFVPDSLKWEKNEKLGNNEKTLVLELVEKVCVACNRERVREGKALLAELKGLIQILFDNIKMMSSHRKETQKTLKARYIEKINKLGLQKEMDSQRLAQEVVIQIDKLDIHEEVTRFKEHIKNANELFKKTEPIGKKLDFYSQELLREVNTIGSKSFDSELTKVVVETKSVIERIREQVQNVE